MAKQKKKRNKVYKGADAAARPVVTKVSAVNRNKLQQWWFEKKRIVKPIAITALVIAIVVWLIFELIRVISGS